MKKHLLIACLLFLGMAGIVKASDDKFIVPVSVNRIADIDLKSVGVEKVTLVTSTTPALATDRNGVTMTSGLIYWVILPSTGAATTNYLEFRDSATANGSSIRLIPVLMPKLNTANGLQREDFNPPVPFYNGLSVNIKTNADVAPTAGLEFAVGTRTKR